MKSAVREEDCDLRSGSEIGLSHPPLEQEEAGTCMQSSEGGCRQQGVNYFRLHRK